MAIKSLKLKIKNYQNGFTLLELLVSIAVIIIVSSAVMVGRSGEEQKTFLRTTAFTLSQNLREYQEKALSGENVDCGVGKSVCGFGVNFKKDDDFYTPFVDCSVDCSTSNHALDVDDVTPYPVISLGKSKICSMLYGAIPPFPTFNVVFSPPDPIVYLSNAAWAAAEGEINLCLKANTSIIKKIKLNNAGKIEIQ